MQIPRLMTLLLLVGVMTTSISCKKVTVIPDPPIYPKRAIYSATLPNSSYFPTEIYIGLEKNELVIVSKNELEALRTKGVPYVLNDALANASVRIAPPPPPP